jgi:hypothetical protein
VQGGVPLRRPGEATVLRSETYGGFDQSGPEVQARSRIVRDWHIGHLWRVGGCLRWSTEIEVQGVARTVTVPGRHVER